MHRNAGVFDVVALDPAHLLGAVVGKKWFTCMLDTASLSQKTSFLLLSRRQHIQLQRIDGALKFIHENQIVVMTMMSYM